MVSKVLLPEAVTRQDGTGPEIELDEIGTSLLLTLGITRILERENLDVSVWGSADGKEWRQLAAFPRKFYCGTYSIPLDLARHPDVRQVRAQWRMSSWDMLEPKPLFSFYLHAEDLKLLHAGAA